MNTDAYFTIGNSHLVCEDYALSSTDKVVVCDGCSSSEMTDVGARLLALTACSALNKNSTDLTLEYIKDNILDLIHRFSSYPDTMFDATLLMAKSLKEDVKVTVIGDGVVVAKRKGKDILNIFNLEYLNGYPYYITYEINPSRKELYFNEDPILSVTGIDIDKNKYTAFNEALIFDKTEILKKYFYEIIFPKSEYEWISLISDGIHTFRNKEKYSITIEKIISELTNFKTFTGEFVKRRLNKFKKDCAKKEWTHYDDLSMAVIYLGE